MNRYLNTPLLALGLIGLGYLRHFLQFEFVFWRYLQTCKHFLINEYFSEVHWKYTKSILDFSFFNQPPNYTVKIIQYCKLGCVVRMDVDTLLLHTVSGPNDHRKDAPPFTVWNSTLNDIQPRQSHSLHFDLFLINIRKSFNSLVF